MGLDRELTLLESVALAQVPLIPAEAGIQMHSAGIAIGKVGPRFRGDERP